MAPFFKECCYDINTMVGQGAPSKYVNLPKMEQLTPTIYYQGIWIISPIIIVFVACLQIATSPNLIEYESRRSDGPVWYKNAALAGLLLPFQRWGGSETVLCSKYIFIIKPASLYLTPPPLLTIGCYNYQMLIKHVIIPHMHVTVKIEVLIKDRHTSSIRCLLVSSRDNKEIEDRNMFEPNMYEYNKTE